MGYPCANWIVVRVYVMVVEMPLNNGMKKGKAPECKASPYGDRGSGRLHIVQKKAFS